MNILITGGNGYIAKNLKQNVNYNITTVSRHDFDLADTASVHKWFRDKTFDVVIHTAISGGSRLKPDDSSILESNLKMYYNLYNERHQFGKLISFGSGAEIFAPNTPYGESKRRIAESIENTNNFYNLRIFNVFDENELETRFVKANIIRHIRKQPIIIFNDKIMDFYYMKDLVSLVNYYIKNDDLSKQINCSYETKYTLKQIANFINSLDNHRVPVIIENKRPLEFYCDSSHNLNINELGLYQGLIDTYRILKQRG